MRLRRRWDRKIWPDRHSTAAVRNKLRGTNGTDGVHPGRRLQHPTRLYSHIYAHFSYCARRRFIWATYWSSRQRSSLQRSRPAGWGPFTRNLGCNESARAGKQNRGEQRRRHHEPLEHMRAAELSSGRQRHSGLGKPDHQQCEPVGRWSFDAADGDGGLKEFLHRHFVAV